MNVILAEDDLDIQLVARLALKRAGFTSRSSATGRKRSMRQAEPPDVILLDWMMPELDGPETCRRLKADPATASIPVIFLTAKSQEAEIQRGLSLGAAGYVTKPFDALTLGQHVKDIELIRTCRARKPVGPREPALAAILLWEQSGVASRSSPSASFPSCREARRSSPRR